MKTPVDDGPTEEMAVFLSTRQQRLLKEVVGLDKVPADLPTGFERGYQEPVMQTLLDQIKADIVKRDALIPELEKAREASQRAGTKESHLREDIRALNQRAATSREAFEVLSKRRRVP